MTSHAVLHEQAEHIDAPDRCSSTPKNLLHRGGRPPHHVNRNNVLAIPSMAVSR